MPKSESPVSWVLLSCSNAAHGNILWKDIFLNTSLHDAQLKTKKALAAAVRAYSRSAMESAPAQPVAASTSLTKTLKRPHQGSEDSGDLADALPVQAYKRLKKSCTSLTSLTRKHLATIAQVSHDHKDYGKTCLVVCCLAYSAYRFVREPSDPLASLQDAALRAFIGYLARCAADHLTQRSPIPSDGVAARGLIPQDFLDRFVTGLVLDAPLARLMESAAPPPVVVPRAHVQQSARAAETAAPSTPSCPATAVATTRARVPRAPVLRRSYHLEDPALDLRPAKK